MQPRNPWPVLWYRSLRSPQATARHNALAAARVLAQRRAEREAIDLFLADHARSRNTASTG